MDSRELRLDALRGLVLLAIFVDHIEYVTGAIVLSTFTLQGWYWCDAAEVLIFLAGYVCGRSYLKTLDQNGFAACQWKGFSRAAQLYAANLACLLIILDLVLLFGPPEPAAFARLKYEGLHHGLGWVAAASVAMLYQPLGVDVLTLYIQFVLILPLFLACWKRWPWITAIFCFESYVAAQWLVCFNIPRWPWDDPKTFCCNRYFHHVAWNMLFFLGAIIGIKPLRLRYHTVSRAVFFLCLAGVLTIVATTIPSLSDKQPLLTYLRSWAFSVWRNKPTLGPFRLVAFLMLAYLTSIIITESRCRRVRWALSPLLLLGRNSLFAYSIGLVWAHGSWLWVREFSPTARNMAVFIYELTGVGLIFAALLVRERLLQRARQRISIEGANIV